MVRGRVNPDLYQCSDEATVVHREETVLRKQSTGLSNKVDMEGGRLYMTRRSG
jgi:hypothetical protein